MLHSQKRVGHAPSGAPDLVAFNNKEEWTRILPKLTDLFVDGDVNLGTFLYTILIEVKNRRIY